MAKAKQPISRWHDGTTDIDELSTSEKLAHDIVSVRKDLEPSVQRIMDAELEDDQRDVALTAFGNSLDRVDDPNRDPRVAIANAAS